MLDIRDGVENQAFFFVSLDGFLSRGFETSCLVFFNHLGNAVFLLREKDFVPSRLPFFCSGLDASRALVTASSVRGLPVAASSQEAARDWQWEKRETGELDS